MYVEDDMLHPVVYCSRMTTDHVGKVVFDYFLVFTSAGSARRYCVGGLLFASRFNPAPLFFSFLASLNCMIQFVAVTAHLAPCWADPWLVSCRAIIA